MLALVALLGSTITLLAGGIYLSIAMGLETETASDTTKASELTVS